MPLPVSSIVAASAMMVKQQPLDIHPGQSLQKATGCLSVDLFPEWVYKSQPPERGCRKLKPQNQI